MADFPNIQFWDVNYSNFINIDGVVKTWREVSVVKSFLHSSERSTFIKFCINELNNTTTLKTYSKLYPNLWLLCGLAINVYC